MPISTSIQSIKNYIEEQLTHPFLKRNLGTPNINEDKLKILMIPFNGNVELKEMKYIATTMLVEIALNTHDQVSVEEEASQVNRQLTVLAGDYFSGLYYQILANMDNLALIQALASGIKIINENKIRLNQQKVLSTYDAFTCVKNIETAHIQAFFAHFNEDKHIERVTDYLLAKRLEKETNLFMKTNQSSLYYHVNGQYFPDKVNNLDSLTINEKQQLVSEVKGKINAIKETTNLHFSGQAVHNSFVKEAFSLATQASAMTNLYAEEG
ncbi:heptaprenyl diphosphate synthase component 1 [Bacillus spongiae]|uniref:Heptaprenyl diphosphate synthase component 1 n=1 Tax=Bacillus spongiae TaxID=2683610 RepID=A0ABU8HD75_9BACI